MTLETLEQFLQFQIERLRNRVERVNSCCYRPVLNLRQMRSTNGGHTGRPARIPARRDAPDRKTHGLLSCGWTPAVPGPRSGQWVLRRWRGRCCPPVAGLHRACERQPRYGTGFHTTREPRPRRNWPDAACWVRFSAFRTAAGSCPASNCLWTASRLPLASFRLTRGYTPRATSFSLPSCRYLNRQYFCRSGKSTDKNRRRHAAYGRWSLWSMWRFAHAVFVNVLVAMWYLRCTEN